MNKKPNIDEPGELHPWERPEPNNKWRSAIIGLLYILAYVGIVLAALLVVVPAISFLVYGILKLFGWVL